MKKKLLPSERKERLNRIVNLLLGQYSEKEIVEALNNESGESYHNREDLELSDFSEDEMVSHLNGNGYCIFKPLYSYQEDQLKEYAENHVFTCYNDQQLAIL